jgi:hypothetical protein
MKFVRSIAIASLAILLSHGASAQVNPKFADVESDIQLLRSMAQSERREIVAMNLPLTAEEGSLFWPVYNEYRTDAASVQDKRVKVITDFAAKYQTLTDDDARKLVDEYLGYQGDVLKVRQKYSKKFEKVLSGTKLARFLQIENRLDAITDLMIARQIPLSQ